MPRYVRGKRAVTKKRAEQAKKIRINRKGKFIDPFPLGFGTLPEKMVYAELSRRGIPFLYLNDLRFVFPEIDFDKTYQADFVIPAHKIIIEVNGSFWHSKPSTIEADAFKYAVYQQAGYRILIWWDYDIFSRLQDLFNQEPILGQYNPRNDRGSSELPVQSRLKTDTSKGIRTLNRRRAFAASYKKKAVRLRKA